MQGHEVRTRGGWLGHWVRRFLHVGMIVVPGLYYYFGVSRLALWVLLLLLIVLEMVRLVKGFQIFGQREHESKRISSFAWGAGALLIVLLFAPKMFAYPIVATCALVDPLMGELRRFQLSSWSVAVAGVLLTMLIWLLAWHWLMTPWWWAIIMGPLSVAAEWPQLKWIDDNAMMQLIPLVVVLLV